jgi:hypothetical protein
MKEPRLEYDARFHLAVHLVKKEVFDSKAKEFIKKELTFTETYVTSTIIDATNKVIEISVLGELITNEKVKEIQKRLIQYDLPETSLILHQAKEQHIDITALKSNIVSDLYKENLMALEEKNKQISTLESQINQDVSKKQTWLDLSNEISVQYPEIKDIYVSEAMQWSKGEGKVAENLTILNLKTTSELTPDTIYKITEWFKVRIKSDNVKVIVE